MKKLWPALLLAIMVIVAHPEAEAKRLGGGKSVGQQSSNVTQREAAPGAPTQNFNQAAPRPANAAPAAAAAAPKKPWGAMLGGLAAGLGLAWLAHSLGFGEGLAQFLLFALVGIAILAVVAMVLRKRQTANGTSASPFAFQGAGAGSPANAPVLRDYSPDKVGNDASARPWERNSMSFENSRSGGSMIGSALAGSQNWGVPDGFDAAGFVEAAKRNFITLQAAWDRSDVSTLRSMMTDSMLAEIRSQLAERESHRGEQHPNQTDVVMLEAQLLGIEDLGDAYMASVEFSGMIREEASAGPNPFREVWIMTKPKTGSSGWLVAGVQALQ
ncbi:Tim44 domain-containing protein [Giesbergeria giesbergeri]